MNILDRIYSVPYSNMKILCYRSEKDGWQGMIFNSSRSDWISLKPQLWDSNCTPQQKRGMCLSDGTLLSLRVISSRKVDDGDIERFHHVDHGKKYVFEREGDEPLVRMLDPGPPKRWSTFFHDGGDTFVEQETGEKIGGSHWSKKVMMLLCSARIPSQMEIAACLSLSR